MDSLWVSIYVYAYTWVSIVAFLLFQGVPRDPTVVAPAIVLRKDVDVIFAD